ncbi:MAG: FHA domain-containing protein [Thiothrix sp.]|nr:MAG: FHA domain-containing protein [Thiothrix sp.]
MTELIVSLNNQILQKFKLAEAKYLLGRSQHCDIILSERTVSAEHAQIVKIGTDCFLEDLASTNGVYVNHLRTQKHCLLDHDLIQIGKYELSFIDPLNRYKQVYELCINTQQLEEFTDLAYLELMSGEKIGSFIPLKNNQFILRPSAKIAETIRIETTPDRQYVLYLVDKQEVTSSRALQDKDTFRLGELILKFHDPAKLAKL